MKVTLKDRIIAITLSIAMIVTTINLSDLFEHELHAATVNDKTLEDFMDEVSTLYEDTEVQEMSPDITFTKEAEDTVIVDDTIMVPVDVATENVDIEYSDIKRDIVKQDSQELIAVEDIAKNSDYEAVENNDDSITLSKIYQSKTLIVKSSVQIDTYDAETVISGWGDLYILKFSTEQDTKKAYEKLLKNEHIESVEIDSILSSETLNESEEISSTEEMETTIVEEDATKMEENTEDVETTESSKTETSTEDAETIESSETETPTEDVETTESSETETPTEDAETIESSETETSTEDAETTESSETEIIEETVNIPEGVIVAIIDSGIDKSNTLFADRIIDLGLNLSTSGEGIQDDNGHGTAVASIIANNSNAYLMPIKIANSEGKGTALSLYLAIQAAIENKADIINISLTTSNSDLLTSVIKECEEKGIVVVAAAGNQSANVENYAPANIESIITVAATDKEYNPASYSNYGELIDYAALGEMEVETLNGKTVMTGTSLSAAYVTAVIVKSIDEEKAYSDYVYSNGENIYFGNGVISLEEITLPDISNVDIPKTEEQEIPKDQDVNLEAASYISGSSGAKWEFIASSGTLKITKGGIIADFSSFSETPWASYKNDIKKVVMEYNQVNIPAHAFEGCTNLTKLQINVSNDGTTTCKMTSIGDYAFNGCSSLETITLASGSTAKRFNNSTTTIGNYAFNGCSKLTYFPFGDSSKLATIGNYGFYGTGITEVIIPKSSKLNKIGTNAFPLNASIRIKDSFTCGENAFDRIVNVFTYDVPVGYQINVKVTGEIYRSSERCTSSNTFNMYGGGVSVDASTAKTSGTCLATFTGSTTEDGILTTVVNNTYSYKNISTTTNTQRIFFNVLHSKHNNDGATNSYDIVLTATVDKSIYNVTWNPNGGLIDGNTHTNGVATTIQFGTSTINQNGTTYTRIPDWAKNGRTYRTGYAFKGWYDATSGGNQVFDASGNYKTNGNYWNSSGNWSKDSNVTLYAQWEPAYTIQFNANGGTGSLPTTITKTGSSSSVTMGDINNTVPTRSGYVFRGWSASSSWNSKRIAYGSSYGGSEAYDGTKATTTSSSWSYATYCTNTGGDSSNRTLTLYAQWDPIQYSHTLTYNANGGSGAPSTQTVTNTSSGETTMIVSSTKPTRTGYTFTGWNTAQSGKGTSYSSGQPAYVKGNETITLYAQWSVNTYKVQFNYNGGAAGPVNTAMGYAEANPHTGHTATETSGNLSYTTEFWLSDPTRTGHVFTGWTISNSDTSTRLFYNGNTSSWEANTNSSIKTHGSGYAGTYHTTGYRQMRSTSGTVTFTANWEPVEYEIKVDYQGGQLTGSIAGPGGLVNGSILEVYGSKWGYVHSAAGEKNYWTSSTPSTGLKLQKTGYTFKGFYTSTSGGTQIIDSNGKIVVEPTYFTSNATIYAQWTPVQYTVTYNGNGSTSGSTASQTFNYGGSVKIASNGFTKTGYTFTGWNTKADGSGTAYAAGATYNTNANLTLYAQWKLNTYTVTYNGNGSTGGSTAKQTFNHGSSVKISANGFTRTGYTFTGWNTKADGTGTAYAAGATYNTNANLTLYAQWKINTYTITYNGNGNTGGSTASQTFNYGGSVKISANGFTKTDYEFVEWNTRADGLGEPYNPNDTYAKNANLTLYAQWKLAKIDIPVKINWDDENNNIEGLSTGVRPAKVTLKLMNGSTVVATATVTGNHSVPATSNVWNYKFEGLDKFDSNGNVITYKVVEEQPSCLDGSLKYEVSYSSDTYTITNVLDPEEPSEEDAYKVVGTITWLDENDKYHFRPDSVIVELYQNGKKINEIEIPQGTTAYEFTGLEKYDRANAFKTYEYKVVERTVNNYSITYKAYETSVTETDSLGNKIITTTLHYDVTNTFTPNTETIRKSNNVLTLTPYVKNGNSNATDKDYLAACADKTENIFVTLKQMDMEWTAVDAKNGKYTETYGNTYSGIEFNMLLNVGNTSTMTDIMCGKYEIVVADNKSFDFKEIKELAGKNATFSYENGKYYVTLSYAYEEASKDLEVNFTLDSFNGYESTHTIKNLYKLFLKKD